MRYYLAILVLTTASFLVRAQTSDLDGQAYTIHVQEENEEGEVTIWTDVIRFEKGKVWADFSQKIGFPPALYTLEMETAAGLTTYYISAEATLETGETLTWTIAITDQYMSGEASRSKTGSDYVFDGKLN